MNAPDHSSPAKGGSSTVAAEGSPTQHKHGVTPWKIILPIVIVAMAYGVGWLIVNSKPEPEKKTPPPRVVAVETVDVSPETIRLSVHSQGTVQPRVETNLTAEVAGRIEEVSRNFREGGFIKKGEMLIQIDPVDYEAALADAKANLAQAKFNLAQEQALSEQAAADWEDLGRGEPTDLALRKPQLEQAKAAIESAEAAVTRAQRNLERTEVRAPYDGRVVTQTADIGQFVGANSTLGTIYGTDVAEVFLPLSDEELARLDLPSDLDSNEHKHGPKVTLSTDYGNRRYTWEGYIVRTGAAFDQRSRLLDVVVEVEDPLASAPDQPGRPPLKPGKFVQAKIEGRRVEDAFVIPRSALREGDTVLVATPENTLAQREVAVTQADTEEAIISEGLQAGDRVITSPVEYVIEGMKLKIQGDEPTEEDDATEAKSADAEPATKPLADKS